MATHRDIEAVAKVDARRTKAAGWVRESADRAAGVSRKDRPNAQQLTRDILDPVVKNDLLVVQMLRIDWLSRLRIARALHVLGTLRDNMAPSPINRTLTAPFGPVSGSLREPQQTTQDAWAQTDFVGPLAEATRSAEVLYVRPALLNLQGRFVEFFTVPDSQTFLSDPIRRPGGPRVAAPSLYANLLKADAALAPVLAHDRVFRDALAEIVSRSDEAVDTLHQDAPTVLSELQRSELFGRTVSVTRASLSL